MNLDPKSTAFVFPGQGSQAVGMGKELAESFAAARETFEEADAILGFPLSGMMWGGPAETHNDTINTQPALYVHSVAVLRIDTGLPVDLPRARSVMRQPRELIAHVWIGADGKVMINDLYVTYDDVAPLLADKLRRNPSTAPQPMRSSRRWCGISAAEPPEPARGDDRAVAPIVRRRDDGRALSWGRGVPWKSPTEGPFMAKSGIRTAIAPVLGVALTVATGCMDPGAPGNLVPATVEDDPSLPRIEVNGTILHAEAYGNPSAPMIMMLHGGPGGDYRSLLPYRALADEGYYVVFWDHRGAGLSKRHDASSYKPGLEFYRPLERCAQRIEQARQHERERLEIVDRPLEIE